MAELLPTYTMPTQLILTSLKRQYSSSRKAAFNFYTQERKFWTSLVALIVFLIAVSGNTQAQIVSDTLGTPLKKWYDKETIYLQGSNRYVKNNMMYAGQKSLLREFSISEGGLQLYLKSRRTRNIGLAISIAGSAGTIVSLITGNRDHLRKFFWVSLGSGVISSAVTMQANNQRDQAVWLRNRDAVFLIDANN
ncbi:MAG TPA: hypothetical protein VGN64_13855 [Dyadobacter sp.]|jgi:hypothetical protein|nr:hypothetical protein [Dyadobacter sp.]